MKKKVLALVMTLAMALSLIPVTALATGDDAEGQPPAAEFSCTFNEETNTLTILGSGPMPEKSTFTGNKFPWRTYQAEATEIIVPEGITTIAAEAFQAFKQVTKLTLPSTLTTISDSAFQNCSALTTSLELSGVDIGKCAFASCTGLTSVNLTASVDPTTSAVLKKCTVASIAFSGCTGLTSVVMENCEIAANAFSSAFGGDAATLSFTGCTILGNIYGLTANSVEEITLTDCTVGSGAFSASFKGSSLKSLEVTGGTLGSSAFSNNPGLESVTLSNVTVGSTCFSYCSALKNISITEVPSIGSRAFDGCTAVENLTIPKETKLAYSDIFLSKNKDGSFKFPALAARVESILKDKFDYKDVPEDAELTVPEGWESAKIGENNGVAVDTNQITKAAKWVDEAQTTAEVQLQFSHVGRPGTDFVFLLDYSNSMTSLGSTADDNSRFYNMQSKVADVATTLLSTEGYNNRVAIVSFGGNTDYYDEAKITTTVGTMDFTADARVVSSYIMADNPYNEDTDYSTGLETAEELIDARTDTTRTPVIIFISDGKPNVRTADHAAIAKQIREKGINIFGVMQSVPSKQEAKCSAAMQEICSDGLFFKADDTKSFSDAVNAAVGASYGYFTVTDAINTENFSFVDGSIVTSGDTTATYDEDTGVITWNLNGIMPYQTYTLNFQLKLNTVQNGTFETNSAASAQVFSSGSTEASNKVASPSLTRNIKKSSGRDHSSTVTIPDGLNGADHYAYVVGYPDGLVYPQNNITRAEVATIFFRLLEDETREANMTKSNSYSDVQEDAWYNCAVSTLSKMGIIKGYEDGSFQPNAPISRAEFAAIAARFDPDGDTTPATFSDVSGHWAKDEISIAANHGWIKGYEDGSFKPDQKITRAETMTLVNRVLKRLPETKDDLHQDMKTWPDNQDESAWYYLAVQEATNSHYQNLKADGTHEKWESMRETRDWAALEK